MIQVIRSVFGYDLTGWKYLSAGELEKREFPLSSEEAALLRIYADYFIAAKEGDHLPLGFLYQGDTAFSAVEQPDGSLCLLEYSLHLDQAPADLRNVDADLPLYTTVSNLSAVTSQELVAALYQ